MNLLKDLKSKFNLKEKELLNNAELAAETSLVKLYLVGGPVRDLLLGNDCHDLDLLIDGNIELFVNQFNMIMNCQPVHTSQFNTYKYIINGNEIDIALARTEVYPFPASLPQITPSHIYEDLYRRDFTINSIAIQLFPKPYDIIDPLNGKEDLNNKTIKVIHKKSFEDDPTRILRALRYSARFEFGIDKNTSDLIGQDINYLSSLSGKRIINDLFKYLTETDVYKSLSRLTEYNLLQNINHNFPNNEEFVKALDIFKNREFAIPDKQLILLSILCGKMDETILNDFIAKCSLPKSMTKILVDLINIKNTIHIISSNKQPSEVSNLFDGYEIKALLLASIIIDNTNFTNLVNEYTSRWSQVKPFHNSNEIIEILSIDKTHLTSIINKIRNAHIDGIVVSKSDEKKFIQNLNGTN